MKTLCITMGPEWSLAEAEFKRVGLQVEPFQAIVEDNRVLAFNKSVYECMKLARKEWFFLSAEEEGATEKKWTSGFDYEDLLLFEDDVAFDLPNCVDYRGNQMNDNARIFDLVFSDAKRWSLPKDFMTLHLGCNIIGSDTIKWQMPTNGTPRIARLHNCWQSHATLYSAECVKYIIDNFKYVTDEYKIEGCQIFDEWLRTNVLNQGRSYVLNPMIAYQRPRFSEIWNREADYTGAHKQGNNWLKENL